MGAPDALTICRTRSRVSPTTAPIPASVSPASYRRSTSTSRRAFAASCSALWCPRNPGMPACCATIDVVSSRNRTDTARMRDGSPMSAAIYARISHDPSGERLGVQRQEADRLEEAKRRGVSPRCTSTTTSAPSTPKGPARIPAPPHRHPTGVARRRADLAARPAASPAARARGIHRALRQARGCPGDGDR